VELVSILKIGLAFLFVLLNGWFVLAEFALVKVRTTRLQELADGGHRGAARALAITQRLDQYLSAIQLGITLASLALGWLGEPAIASLLHPLFEALPGSAAIAHGIASAVAFTLITFLHVVLGEMAPKTMAIQSAEKFAISVSRPLHGFYVLTYPLILLFQGASNKIVRLIGFKPAADAEAAHTEEELRMIVATSHKHGVLDQATRDLIDNVLDYTERVAREVMTPRRDVVVLDVTAPVEHSVALAIEKEYTRYPLVDPETDRVTGFVHVKDLIAIVTGRKQIASLTEIARQPVFVPEGVQIDRVRRQLQAKRAHLGIVVDEFGDFVGIVTLEDLLEELVGEIQDELDVEQPKIVRRSDGTIDVDAGLHLDVAEKRLKLRLSEEIEGVDTLGGYVFTLIGRAPVPGDTVVIGDHRLEVLEVDEMRIRRVRVSRLPAAETTGAEPTP
jgi:CBS domain containing-hemolysin-like protein